MRSNAGIPVPRPGLLVACAAAALLAAAVAGPVAATAGKDELHYKGHLAGHPAAKVSFTLTLEHGDLVVRDFHSDDIPISCPSGHPTSEHFGINRIKVKDNGRFSKGTYFGDFRGDEHADASGRLRPNGKARGVVNYHEGFDGVGICDSGELPWKAGS